MLKKIMLIIAAVALTAGVCVFAEEKANDPPQKRQRMQREKRQAPEFKEEQQMREEGRKEAKDEAGLPAMERLDNWLKELKKAVNDNDKEKVNGLIAKMEQRTKEIRGRVEKFRERPGMAGEGRERLREEFGNRRIAPQGEMPMRGREFYGYGQGMSRWGDGMGDPGMRREFPRMERQQRRGMERQHGMYGPRMCPPRMRMQRRGMGCGYGYGYGFGGGAMNWRDNGFPQRRGMGPLKEDMNRQPYSGGRGRPMQRWDPEEEY